MATLETNVRQVNSDFQAIKNKIVEKGVNVADGTRTSEYASKVDKVYEAGKQAEYNAFWDTFQENGNRTTYANAFSNSYWREPVYNPKYPFMPTVANGCYGMFAWNTKITDIKMSITLYDDLTNMFHWCSQLKRIPKLIWNSTVTNVKSMFDSCPQLEELNCEGVIEISGINLQWSTKLSKASIESVINALDITEGRPASTITLSLAAVTAAFGDVSGYNDEFDNLCASARTANWTISLV